MLLNKRVIIPFLARLMSGIGGFLITTLMLEFLKAEEVGIYYLVVAVVTFFHWFFVNPVASFITTRALKYKRVGVLNIVMRYYLTYLFILIIASLPICYLLIFYKVIVIFPKSLYLSIISFLIVFVAASTNLLFASILNMIGFYIRYYLILNIEVWLRFLFGFLVLKYFIGINRPFNFIIVTSAVSIIVSIISLFFVLRNKDTPKIKNMTLSLREIFNYSWPISVATFFQWFQSQGWKIVLERFSSLRVVGLISIASSYSIALVAALSQILDQISLPKFYGMYSSTKNEILKFEIWKKYAIWVSKRIFLGCIFIAIVTSLLIARISHGVYIYLIPIAIIFVLSELIRVHISIFQQRLFAGIKTFKMLLPFTIGCLTLLPMIYWGNKYFNIYGVSVALLLSGIIILVIFLFQSNSESKAIR